MKVLLVHEYYRSSSPSGEDKVFERERELLRQSDVVEVGTLTFYNDDIGSTGGPSVLKTALFTPWSPLGAAMIRRAVDDFQPDIVHFHNTFPVFSQSAIIQVKKMGVATVQTFHNFRSVCAQAMLMRDGVCEECLGRYPWPALKYRCYRDSLAATLPLFFNITLHRWLGTWEKQVDRFIVLSDFNRDKFIEAGFPAAKIRVKPNFFTSSFSSIPEKDPAEWVFVGRLKEEKGVQFLPMVWQRLGKTAPVLHVLGDGPLREMLQQQILQLNLDSKMILHGHCSSVQVNEILERSSLLLFPSICYEGFPLVIGEAYAAGVPIAASKIGTPAFIVRDGVTGIHFQPGDVDDMVARLTCLQENPNILQTMSANARKEYENNYTAEANFEILMKIYREAMAENRNS